MEQIKQLPVTKDQKQELVNKALLMVELTQRLIEEIRAECELNKTATQDTAKVEIWIREWIYESSLLSEASNLIFQDRIGPIGNSISFFIEDVCRDLNFNSAELLMLKELYTDFIAAKKNTFNPDKKET